MKTTQPTPQPAGDAFPHWDLFRWLLTSAGYESVSAGREAYIASLIATANGTEETARAIQAGKGEDYKRGHRAGWDACEASFSSTLTQPANGDYGLMEAVRKLLAAPGTWTAGHADALQSLRESYAAALAGSQGEGVTMRVLQCPNCPTSVETQDKREFVPCLRCGVYMEEDPTAKPATAPDPAAPDGDGLSVSKEWLASKLSKADDGHCAAAMPEPSCLLCGQVGLKFTYRADNPDIYVCKACADARFKTPLVSAVCDVVAANPPTVIPDGMVVVPKEVRELYDFMAMAFSPFTSQQEQIDISLRKAKAAMKAMKAAVSSSGEVQ